VAYVGGSYYNSATRQYSMSLCKTTNGGRTWAGRRSLGVGGDYRTSCRDIAVAPGDSAIVYAGGQDDGFVKIFLSNDAGRSWTNITDDLASMHSRDDILYAIWVSPYYQYSLLVGTSRGVYKTIAPIGRSSGITGWSRTPLRYSTCAFAYYQAKETVYAGTESEGVYFTSDGGSTWNQLNDGLECLKVLSMGLDSENGWLYAGTDGGAVWRLGIVDVNSDGAVDFGDFACFADNWMNTCTAPDWCRGCDLNSSGAVDIRDLVNLAGHWLR
jgi:photosystem II stability/assembly factor-like uncharacterized protein